MGGTSRQMAMKRVLPRTKSNTIFNIYFVFLSNFNENIAFYLLIFILKMTDFQFVCFPLKRVGGPYVGAGPFSAQH